MVFIKLKAVLLLRNITNNFNPITNIISTDEHLYNKEAKRTNNQ